MGLILAAALSQAFVPTAVLPPYGGDPCAPFDTPADAVRSPRVLTACELAQIADIGRSDSNESASPFGISPDGERIAFLVRRANVDANAYCQRLLVTSMDGGGQVEELDRGGAFIRTDFRLRGFSSLMAGYAKVITPRWSPDGDRIAFLKREKDSTQVWVVDSNGEAPARQVTGLPDDVDDFAWGAEGAGLVVATRPGIRIKAEAIAREARSGFLFDERFSPQFADRPIPRGPLTTIYTWVDLTTGASRPAAPTEIARLVPPPPANKPRSARAFTEGAAGSAAWIEPKYPRRLISPTRLVMSLPDGRRVTCEDARCEGTRHLWWSADGRTLYTLQKTGTGMSDESELQLMRWDIGARAPQQVLVTEDVLVGCELSGEELVCAREGAAQPRRLVAIDPDTGRERLIYDPNPAFRSIELGEVQRLHFSNAYGEDSYADLVLPPDHKPGEKHPLVVVQYASHGFLRGGTGDEVPIHVLAAKGFAVLSFARPDFVVAAMEAETERELLAANRDDWIDRRNVQSSLERAVELALATGAVDGERMGISGFSDGSSTVQWALINASLFKAASLGHCCAGMNAYLLAAGPEFAQASREAGRGFYFEPGAQGVWKPLSLALNAESVDIPILIQTNDSEYEGGLDVVAKFKYLGKPIELYVFEDETHVKWQPAHRLAVYERTVEWFQFWLMNTVDCNPAKADQYARWQAMKGAPATEVLRCEAGPHSPFMTALG